MLCNFTRMFRFRVESFRHSSLLRRPSPPHNIYCTMKIANSANESLNRSVGLLVCVVDAEDAACRGQVVCGCVWLRACVDANFCCCACVGGVRMDALLNEGTKYLYTFFLV